MNKRTSLILALSNNVLGFYNISLYGFFALSLAHLYFPSNNLILSHITALAVFATSFLMRPLGGIFFRYIGGTYGYKKTFTLSIVLTTIPTFIIGVLPSFTSIGNWAPGILIGCVLVQGLCTAGAYTSASLLMVEYRKQNKVGFACSLIPASNVMGIGIAAVLGTVVTLNFMPSWSWRIPFLLSVILGFCVFSLRHHVVEIPVSQEVAKIKKYPLSQVLALQKRNFFCSMAVSAASAAGFYILMMSTLGLSVNSSLSLHQSMLVNAIVMMVMLFSLPLMGYLSDKIGIKRVMQWGVMAIILTALPLFWLMHQNTSVMKVVIIMVTFAVLYASFLGPSGVFLTYLFLPEERHTGLGFSTTIGAATLGAMTTLFAVWLLHVLDNGIALALYFMVCAFMGWFGVRKAQFVSESSEKETLSLNLYEANRFLKKA